MLPSLASSAAKGARQGSSQRDMDSRLCVGFLLYFLKPGHRLRFAALCGFGDENHTLRMQSRKQRAPSSLMTYLSGFISPDQLNCEFLIEKNQWYLISHFDGCFAWNCAPPKFTCGSFNTQYLWMWLYLEINGFRVRLLGWGLIQSDWWPYKKRKAHRRETRDVCVQRKGHVRTQ